jgi:hypothetical protein
VRYVIADPRLVDSTIATDHVALVYVLPRYWEGEAGVTLDMCGGSGGGHYEWKAAKVGFSLDENLNVVGVASSPGVVPVISPVSDCPGDECGYVPGPEAPARLFIEDVTAQGLSSSYGKPLFSLVCRTPAAKQPVTQHCPGGSMSYPSAGVSTTSFAVRGLAAPYFDKWYFPLGNPGPFEFRMRALPGCE